MASVFVLQSEKIDTCLGLLKYTLWVHDWIFWAELNFNRIDH